MNEFENFTPIKFKWNGDTHYGLFRKDLEECWIEICLKDDIVHFELLDYSLVTNVELLNYSSLIDCGYFSLICDYVESKKNEFSEEHKSDFERFKKEYIDFLKTLRCKQHNYIGMFNSIEEFQENIHNQNYKNGDYAFIKTVKINKDKTEEIIYKRYDKISNDWIFSYDVETLI